MAKDVLGKFKVVFSLDYEIHGNGDGDPYELMIEPTERLLNLMGKYHAKLTIFADVAQISKFKEYFEREGVDKFHYKKIENQLRQSIISGHDVQLHVHSSFFKSYFDGRRWVQSWPEYNLAALSFSQIESYIKFGKNFLESIIKPVFPEYQCQVFRAANWSMHPSANILKALDNCGFKMDSSVYKWGIQKGNATYDYTNSFQQILPYPANFSDINLFSKDSPIFEVPIFCERKNILSFITLIRIFRATRAFFHKHENNTDAAKQGVKRKNIVLKSWSLLISIVSALFSKHPRKLDFNQLTARQQIKAVKSIAEQHKNHLLDVPVVFIGHSKTYVEQNENILEKVLIYIAGQRDMCFSKYSEIETEPYRFYYEK